MLQGNQARSITKALTALRGFYALTGRYFIVPSWIEEPLRLASLPRLRCELVPHQVELMSHGQIKALPRESVTPVGFADGRNAGLPSLLVFAASTGPK